MIHNHTFSASGDLPNFPVGINTLIYGDFEQRWLRINGKLQINPSYISNGDSAYSKILVYNPSSGDTGTKDYVNIPVPPDSGNYVLKTINGSMEWVAE